MKRDSSNPCQRDPLLNAKILIVYGDEIIRESLTALMEREGFRILQASNWKMGLKVVQTTPPDLMLIEIKMADLDGIDLLQKARNFNPNLLIIAITPYGDSHGVVRALEAGAYSYLEKPVPIREIPRVVRQALAKRSLGEYCW